MCSDFWCLQMRIGLGGFFLNSLSSQARKENKESKSNNKPKLQPENDKIKQQQRIPSGGGGGGGGGCLNSS